MRHYIVILLLLAPLAAACSPESTAAADTNENSAAATASGSSSPLPVRQIEQIVGAQGEVTGGILDITIARTDIGNVRGPLGVTFTPAFEIHGDLYLQSIGKNQALLNADMALLEPETNPFIAALLQHGLVFQAFHQHTPMAPQVWFVHFRGIGDPIALARAARAAMDVTHTRLPQPPPPPRPTTPLDAQRLAHILHGEASVGEDGVVTVTVLRTDRVVLDGVRVSPHCGISTTIEFKPTHRDDDAASRSGGKATAQVVPDFSMTAAEVVPVVKRMQIDHHWFQGCLYNQETNEQPQLYFDHMVKEGDAYQLAEEIRSGLDLTRSK